MKVQKTYSELIRFNIAAQNYLSKNTDNKICAAIKTFQKQLQTIFDNYNDERDTLQINNCAVDDKGIIVKNEKGERQFTPQGELKLKADLKDLLNISVEIHSRIADCDYSDLTDDEKKLFSEIVIPKQEIVE